MTTVADQLVLVEVRIAHVERQFTGDEFAQRVTQRELAARGQLDVDALDAVAVVAHAVERNHHVFVDLEGVGVFRDGRGAGAVEPEAFALFVRGGNEAFGGARGAHAHDFRGGRHHGGLVVADDVTHQHHLGPAVALGLGGVANGLHVALVEVLEAGELHACGMAGATGLEVVGDLDDGRHGFAHLAEEFQTDRARVRRHLVQHPTRSHDQAVGAFLLHARHTAEEFVGDVLAQAGLAAARARHGDDFFRQLLAPVRIEAAQAELDGFLLVDLAQVVVEALDLEPVAIGRDHFPPCQVVQRRAPQHGLLAAGVHRDVAADTGGACGGGVDREHAASQRGCFGDALGHHARAGANRSHRLSHARQREFFDRADVDELFGVDDHRACVQRNGAAGVAGAAPARNDGEAQFDAVAHQRRHFLFGVGAEHHEGVFHAPVGGVGDVRDARVAVEADVVAAGVAQQHLLDAFAQFAGFVEKARKVAYRRFGRLHQHGHAGRALGVFGGGFETAFFDFAQTVVHGAHQRFAALTTGQQIVLQVGVALHHPDVAQHFVQHAR